MIIRPIEPAGPGVAVTTASTASAPVTVTGTVNTRHVVVNDGTLVAWFSWNQTGGSAVQIPVPGVPSAAIPMLPASSREFRLTPNSSFSFITP